MQTRLALRRFFAAEGERKGVVAAWVGSIPGRMFLVGFVLRVAYITLAHTYRIRPAQDHFQFGWEMGRIARSLVAGNGYADPFGGHTGSTAWTPPLYPLLMAGIFRLFGVYSNLSAWVLFTVNSFFSAATATALFQLAQRCFGSRAAGKKIALWSGWLWALYPAAMQYAVKWPWDMAITAWCFTWVLVLGFDLRERFALSVRAQGRNLAFSLLWAAIALLNSALLIFLPLQVLWILWPARRQARQWAGSAAVATLLFFVCLTPWIVRNQRALHAFVPLRANFGVELYNGVLPLNGGFPAATAIPVGVPSPERTLYTQMGEVAYSRLRGAQAKAIIAADPGRYLRETLLRVQFYWVGVPHAYVHGLLIETIREADFAFLSLSGLLGLGLALHRRVPGSGLFAGAFLLLPLTYYFITVQARFRHPLEPLITMFSVYLFQNADRTRVWSTTSRDLRAEVQRPVNR